MITNVGMKLREIRKRKNITLSVLSEKVGLSVGFLSNLERDFSSPTLDNIQKVCEGLEISLLDLLDAKKETGKILRKEDRQIAFERKDKIRYESVNFGEDCLHGLFITIQPNSFFEKEWSHGYQEIGVVLEGELVVTISRAEYVLHEGDAFYIKANENHSIANRSHKPTLSYWVKQVVDENITDEPE